jgi:hypothetical protein
LISNNDATILTMFTRYPDISDQEADLYLAKMDSEESKLVGEALLGRKERKDLDDGVRAIYDIYKNWSDDRTQRLRNEEIVARHNKKETDLSLKLNRLHQKGLINDEVMVLYGISGPLPDRMQTARMTQNEKIAMAQQRMEGKFGPNWRERFRSMNIPLITSKIVNISRGINWAEEGF